ncbi:hypothetical protein EON65_00630 [archaeon]|nr:MAG: hypothetical protein EON65_00630 [archaeon]
MKQGKEQEECFVEAELLLSGTRTTTLRRIMNSENRGSKWLRDGVAVAGKVVKELMNELNIDVDNLCSFMPQDKVGLFSQYSPQQVLQETLKTIVFNTSNTSSVVVVDDDATSNDSGESYHNLYEEQQILSTQEESKNQKKKEKESKESAYMKVLQDIESMSTEIERLQDRARAMELKSYCEVRLIKVKANDCKRQITSKDEQIFQLTTQLQQITASYAPLEEKQRDLNKQMTLMERQRETVSTLGSDMGHDCGQIKDKLYSLEDKIEELSVGIVEYERVKQRDERELNKLQQDIASLRQQLQEAEQEQEEIWDTLQELKKKFEIKMQEKGQVEDVQREYNNQLHQETLQLRNIDKEINSVLDPKTLFLHCLSSVNDFAVKQCMHAIRYLHEHEDEMRRSGKLTGKVYGPVAQYLQVTDPACVIMLEKAIPLNKLLGIVVMNVNDRDFLLRELRDRMKLKIDVFTIFNIDAAHHSLTYNNATLQQFYQTYNIQLNSLSKMVVCDDVIRSYLHSWTGLHHVLWTRTKNSISADFLHALCSGENNNVKLYVHDVRDTSVSVGREGVKGRIIEFTAKRSRYASHLPPSTVSTTITPRGILTANANANSDFTQRKQALQEQREQQQGRIAMVEKDVAKYGDQIRTINDEVLAMNSERKRLSEGAKRPQNLKSQLKLKEDNYADKRKKFEDEERVGKKRRYEDYREAVETVMTTVRKYNDIMKIYSEVSIKQQIFELMMVDVSRQIEEIHNQLEEFREQETHVKHQMVVCKSDKDRLNAVLKSLEAELNGKVETMGGLTKFVDEVYPMILLQVAENTVDELENRLIALNAQINAVVDNPHLQRRYDEALKCRDVLQKDLQTLTKSYDDIENTMRMRSESWLKAVRATAAKLNDSFRSYMEKLQFVGEVVLRETGKLVDYELQLRVAFHKDHPLVDLSGHRHSGGERAVSTVMYLMALQEMTSSPFRVVDEINQGNTSF